MGELLGFRAFAARRSTTLLAMAVSLASCESIERSLVPPPPQFPRPITTTAPGGDRVSGILKPAGGQVVRPAVPRATLSEPEILTGPPEPVIPDGAGLDRPVGGGARVGLNFVNADLVEVVDAVVAQSLGLNYVIDPAVTGQVTIRTTEQIPRAALLSVLENILAMNNAAMVLDDSLVTIVPRDAARGLSGVTGRLRSGQPQGQAVYVIPLEHASAESVRGIAQSVLSPGRDIVVEPVRNYLMFSGTSREAQAVQDLVDALDVNQLAGRSFGLFPLEAASAEEVVDELSTVFPDAGDGGPVRFLPVTRMNAILAVARDASYLEQSHAWIRRLDRANEGMVDGAQVYVYHVRNGRAGELAAMLGAVFGEGAPPPARESDRPGVAPTLEPVTIAAREPVLGVESDVGAGPEFDPELEVGLQAAVDTRAGAAQQVFGGAADSVVRDATGHVARFIPDERNNAVVMVATPRQYELAKATLDRLDIVPLQVLIEVTIAEVALNNDLRYGLQWFFESGDFATTLSSFSSGAVSAVFPGFNAVFDSGAVRVVLNALAEVTDVKVISSPQLMVLDNQVARLHVGDQVPVATQQAVSVSDPLAPIVNTIQLIDTGVILEVTPRVNASGLVTLEVLQDVSDAVETITSDIDSPTIQQRTIQTTVAVSSGATVALGGLIRDRTEDGESGIPVLKDVPVLGNLFKTNEIASRRTELLILITPHVVRDTLEAQLVARELQDRLTGLRALEPPPP